MGHPAVQPIEDGAAMQPSIETVRDQRRISAQYDQVARENSVTLLPEKKAELKAHKDAYSKLRKGVEPDGTRGPSFKRRQDRYLTAEQNAKNTINAEVNQAANAFVAYLRDTGVEGDLSEVSDALKTALGASEAKVNRSGFFSRLRHWDWKSSEAKLPVEQEKIRTVLGEVLQGNQRELENAKLQIDILSDRVARSSKIEASMNELEAAANSKKALAEPMVAEAKTIRQLEAEINELSEFTTGKVAIKKGAALREADEQSTVVDMAAYRAQFNKPAIVDAIAARAPVVAAASRAVQEAAEFVHQGDTVVDFDEAPENPSEVLDSAAEADVTEEAAATAEPTQEDPLALVKMQAYSIIQAEDGAKYEGAEDILKADVSRAVDRLFAETQEQEMKSPEDIVAYIEAGIRDQFGLPEAQTDEPAPAVEAEEPGADRS